MKLLRIDANVGEFLDTNGVYQSVDKITKDDLLALVSRTLEDEFVEFDDYDETAIKNQAHQVIYKSIAQRLRVLRGRRQEFIDESARLYLSDYEKYREELPHEAAASPLPPDQE